MLPSIDGNVLFQVGPVCVELNPCKENVLCKDTCKPPYYECVYCDSDHKGLHCDVTIGK